MEARTTTPFFIPKTKGEDDVKYIDKMFTDEEAVDTPLDPTQLTLEQKQDKHFQDFTYSKDGVLHTDRESIDSTDRLEMPDGMDVIYSDAENEDD